MNELKITDTGIVFNGSPITFDALERIVQISGKEADFLQDILFETLIELALKDNIQINRFASAFEQFKLLLKELRTSPADDNVTAFMLGLDQNLEHCQENITQKSKNKKKHI